MMSLLAIAALLYFPQGGEVRVRAQVLEGTRLHIYRVATPEPLLIHVKDEVVPGLYELYVPGTRCGAFKVVARMSMDDGIGGRAISEWSNEVTVVAADANCDDKLNGQDGFFVIRASLGLPVPLDGDLAP